MAKKIVSTQSIFNMFNPWESYAPKDKNKDYYEYIPRHIYPDSLNRYLELFKTIKGRKAKTFLDIGCGKGGMLYTALDCGLLPTGIEYSKELFDLAKKIKNLEVVKGSSSKIALIHADAFEWVPKTDFDIVYFYRPMSNPKTYEEFLTRVRDIFPQGQFIISADGTGKDYFDYADERHNHSCFINSKHSTNITLSSYINKMPIVAKLGSAYVLQNRNAKKHKYLVTTTEPTFVAGRDFRATTKPIDIEIPPR